MSTTKRPTVLLREGGGGRVYADTVKVKTLRGGTPILLGDGVEPFADDWDRDERPRPIVFNEPERGPRC